MIWEIYGQRRKSILLHKYYLGDDSKEDADFPDWYRSNQNQE